MGGSECTRGMSHPGLIAGPIPCLSPPPFPKLSRAEPDTSTLPACCPLADLSCIFTDGVLTARDCHVLLSTLASSGPSCWVQSPVSTSSHLLSVCGRHELVVCPLTAQALFRCPSQALAPLLLDQQHLSCLLT